MARGRIETPTLETAILAYNTVKVKLVGLVLAASFTVLAGIVTTSAVRARDASMDSAMREAELTSQLLAKDLEVDLNYAMDAAIRMGNALSRRIAKGTANRSATVEELRSLLTETPSFFGVGIAFEPNAFDGRDQDFAGKPGHPESGRAGYYVETNQALNLSQEADRSAQSAKASVEAVELSARELMELSDRLSETIGRFRLSDRMALKG